MSIHGNRWIGPAKGIVLACFVLVVGCDAFRAKEPEIAIDVLKDAACVIEHAPAAPEVVAIDCGGLAIEQVVRLLGSKEKAIAAARVGACGK